MQAAVEAAAQLKEERVLGYLLGRRLRKRHAATGQRLIDRQGKLTPNDVGLCLGFIAKTCEIDGKRVSQ